MLLRALLIAWIAVLGLDRIDLLGGRGPVQVQPFHLLSAILVPLLALDALRQRRWPNPPPRTAAYAGILLLVMTLVALSLLASDDVILSAGRATLFLAAAVLTSIVVWLASTRTDLGELLLRGGVAGLALSLAFNVAQLLNLVGLIPNDVEVGPAVLRLEAMRYGILPRFAGTAYDMNRGAMLALVFTTLVTLGRPVMRGRRAWISLGIVMALLSLSRSAALASVPILLLTPKLKGDRAGAWRAAAAICMVVALGAGLLLNTRVRESTGTVTEMIAERVNPSEGSAQVHSALADRAAEVATRSTQGLLFGIGFGMSHRVTTDFFGGNKYGNFHSGWLAILVETGLLSLLLSGMLFILPVVAMGPLAGVVAGLAIFNTFYVFLFDPMLWFVLAVAWVVPQWWRASSGHSADLAT